MKEPEVNFADRLMYYIWKNFTFFLIIVLGALYAGVWCVKSATTADLVVVSILYTVVLAINVYNFVTLKMWVHLKNW